MDLDVDSSADTIGYILGNRNVEAILNYIDERDYDSIYFFNNLNKDECKKLKGIFNEIGLERLGNKQVKAAINLARIVVTYERLGIEFDRDFSKYASVREAYNAIKNTYERRFLEGRQGEGSYRHMIDERHMVVFDPNDKVLQEVACERVQSCFSMRPDFRSIFEVYLKSGSIFLPVIFDTKEKEIVGRFTIAVGRREYEAGNGTARPIVAVMSKVYADFYSDPRIDRDRVANAVRCYAKRIGADLQDKGTFWVEVPRGRIGINGSIYDDYIEEKIAGYKHGAQTGRSTDGICIRLVSPMWYAINKMDMQEFKRMYLAKDYDPNEIYDGIPLLHVVAFGDFEDGCCDKKVEMLSMQLDHPDLDMMIKGRYGNIMHKIISGGGDLLFDTLVNHRNFDVRLLSERNSDGLSPIEMAVNCGNPHIVAGILQKAQLTEDIGILVKAAKDLYESSVQGSKTHTLKGLARLFVNPQATIRMDDIECAKRKEVLEILGAHAEKTRKPLKMLKAS